MKQDQRLTIRFTSPLRKRVKDAARTKGVREADYVREAIEQRLSSDESAPTAYEMALKAGLIGLIREAPSDLATNPIHMEGFGRS